MKSKLATVALIGLMTSTLVLAQTNPAGEAPTSAAPAAIIPLIQFQDVALTEAINNLARQANLNYILDPKVGFGQPDEKTGVVKPQPNITLRWENLTAEQALTALLNNYSLQLIADPRNKISRVTVKDPAAPDPLETKIFQLSYANPSNLLAAVQATIDPKRSKAIADVRTSQMVVVATAKELKDVEDMVARLDTPTKQVLIEARLMETSMNPKSVKGIDWSGTLAAQKFTFGNGNTSGSPEDNTTSIPGVGRTTTLPGGRTITSSPESSTDLLLRHTIGNGGFSINTLKGFSPATAFLNADGVSAVLSFLNTDNDAKVIATPRAVTLDNETANLSVTRAFPIFKNTAGTQGSPGGSEVAYTNLGTILHVTPRVSANNLINLKVVPEVSSIFTTIRKTVASTINEADVYDIRKIETRVMIPSGNTLVLGGLVRDSDKKSYTKVPFLGDVPGLGRAFRSDSKERDQSNLLIFITPTIVEDSDFQPTTTDYLKTPMEIKTEPAWGAYDSGKPLDWSKPIADQVLQQPIGEQEVISPSTL